MLTKETKSEILKHFRKDGSAAEMVRANDVQGLLAKCKEAGYDVTEGDVSELIADACEVNLDEVAAIAGGCGIGGGCGSGSCWQ